MATEYYGPGDYTFEIDPNASAVIITASGGTGGSGYTNTSAPEQSTGGGGAAAEVSARFGTAGLSGTLDITIGGSGSGPNGGFNGGADGTSINVPDYTGSVSGGGGGGYTEVKTSGGNTLIIAGGGGGGGAAATQNDYYTAGGNGGNGGSLAGQDGQTVTDPENRSTGGGGGGGSGGSGGSGGIGRGEGTSGGSRSGGTGGVQSDSGGSSTSSGGAGAGGYGGGGGGGAGRVFGLDALAGGGGGGGSYIDNAGTNTSSGTTFSAETVEITQVVPTTENLTLPYIGANEVDLSWDASNVSEFEVERDGNVIATVSRQSYTDTTPAENTDHTYRVFGVESGSRVASTGAQMVTTGGPPETFGAVWNGSMTVTAFEPNAEYNSLDVYRDASVESESLLVSTTTPPLDYADGPLSQGISYTYRFETVYPRGASSSVTATETVPLPPPTKLTVVSENDGGADISWTDNATDEDGYRVEVQEDGSGTWVTVIDGLPNGTESASVTGLLNGQLYGVRVIAYTADVEEVDV